MANSNPARSNGMTTVVAIDLGTAAVRVVEVEWAGGDSEAGRIVRRGSAPLSAGVWNGPGAARDSLASAIRQALSTAGIATKFAVASLPRRLVTVRFARLPHAPPEQLREMVTYEAQQYVLFPLEEVILDYHAFPNDSGVGGEDLDTILLAAARRTLIADVMGAFDSLGIELKQLSISALALSEHIRDSIDTTALIDVEPGEMDIAIVSNRQLLFTRASALDVQALAADVSTQRTAEEIGRSFTAFQNEFRGKPLSHILLAGESAVGANAASLDTALAGMLTMPVAPLQSRLLSAADPDARAYATAVGMAMQTRSGSIAPINLVPSERAERKAKAARNNQKRVALIGAAAAILVGVVMVRNSFAQRSALASRTLAANTAYNAVKTRFDAEQRSHDETVKLVGDLTRSLDRAHPTVDVLVALDAAMPHATDIWLTQLSFERGGLMTLRGETKSTIAATELVLAMQRSGAFVNVRLGYLGDAQDTGSNAGKSASAPVTNAPVTSPPAAGTGTAATPVLPGMNSGGRPGAPGNNRPNIQPPARPGGSPPGMPVPGGLPPGFDPGAPGGMPGGFTPRMPGGMPPGFPGGNPPAFPQGRAMGRILDGFVPGGGQAVAAVKSSTSGAPVPSITTPPGGIQKVPEAVTPASKATPAIVNTARATLTSFIITCRVNPTAKTLLPIETAKSKRKSDANKAVPDSQTKNTSANADKSAPNMGADDADTQ